jgi:hypothetical protein
MLTSQVAAHEEFTATSQMGDVNRLTSLLTSLTCPRRQVKLF